MGLTTISGQIQSQPLNDNFSYLNERKNDLAFNVKDYGAKGDGVTDDTSAISTASQAAITAGAQLVFPAGTYLKSSVISKTLTANQNVYIRGYGKVIINSTAPEPASGTGTLHFIGDATNKVVIEGIELTHTSTVVGNLHGLYFVNIGSVFLHRVKASGFSLYGIGGEGLGMIYAENCEASNNRYGGMALVGTDGVVAGGTFNDNGVTGSTLQGYGLILNTNYGFVSGVLAQNNNRYNFDIRGGNDVTLSGVKAYNAGQVGIYAVNENADKDVSNLKIIGGTVDNNSRVGSTYGIWTGTFGALATNSFNELLIDGVTIKNTISYGVLVSNDVLNSPEKVTICNLHTKNTAVQAVRIDNNVGGQVKNAIFHNNICVDGYIAVFNTVAVNAHHNIIRADITLQYGIFVNGATYSNLDHNQFIGSIGVPFSLNTTYKIMNGNSLNGIGLKDINHLTIQQRLFLADAVNTTLLTITEPGAQAVQGVIMAKYMIGGGFSTTPGVAAGQIAVGFVFDAGHVITLPGASPYTIVPFGTTTASDGTTFILTWTIETTTNGIILKVQADDSANNGSFLVIDYDILINDGTFPSVVAA